MTIGPSLDETTDMGPLISKRRQEKVLEYISKGKEEGARLIVGGNRKFDKGYYVEPTIFLMSKMI